MRLEFPGAVPEIPVANLAAAAAHYRDNLGFTLDWSDDDLGLAGISKGHCRIFLADATYRKGYGNAGPVLTWLNLPSEEAVDTLYQVWSAHQVTLLSTPESKVWGLYEFTAIDLDGNFFRVFYDVRTAERATDS